MLTPEAQALAHQHETEEFLKDIADVVNKHRGNMPVGSMVGALEIVKMRLFWTTNTQLEKEEK